MFGFIRMGARGERLERSNAEDEGHECRSLAFEGQRVLLVRPHHGPVAKVQASPVPGPPVSAASRARASAPRRVRKHVEYGPLVQRGVHIYQYLPSMMHAKTMLVDDELSVVASINLDPLSLNKLEGVALVVQDRAFAAKLAKTFEEDTTHARPVASR